MIDHQFPNVFRGEGPRHVNLDFLRLIGLDGYYVKGYKMGADRLVDGATADAELFFPAAFLYRQYIELHLKYVLAALRYLDVIPVSDADLHGHSLQKLWKQVREGLLSKWPGSDPQPELDGAERIIMDFHSADPTGQELRYAVTSKGTRSLDKLPGELSLTGFHDTMQKLHEVLESCSNVLYSEVGAIQQEEYNDAMARLEAEESE